MYASGLIALKDNILNVKGMTFIKAHNRNPPDYSKNLCDYSSKLKRKFMRGSNLVPRATINEKTSNSVNLKASLWSVEFFGEAIICNFPLLPFMQNRDGQKTILYKKLAEEKASILKNFLFKIAP